MPVIILSSSASFRITRQHFVGLVQDTVSTKQKASTELPDRSNIHFLAGDLTDYNSLENAAAKTPAITNGNLGYLIANAAFASPVNGFFCYWRSVCPPLRFICLVHTNESVGRGARRCSRRHAQIR